ncbi:uncharacterized protein EDB91DRAFT_1139043 [Suillus paluster]|nr:uncharacterized protein EDB91DRAFT_1139043 [Suillus paluster]KAG1738105.1 hypothetical protein EDB91DRAFT_1139043 [Suillus paluster]
MRVISAEEFVLSGTYQCSFDYGGDVLLLDTISWILGTVWEVFALCLAVWIAVKHFRELQQQSGGRIIENCLTVLIKSHMGYFGSYLATSCFNLGHFSPAISGNPYSTGSQIYAGVAQILLSVQMYVLGPRLVLSIREYHAKLVADSDAATAMTSIAFQERVYVSTSSTV